MGIFSRFSDIVNSNINAILDKAELAISKGRDDLAKAALAEKARVSAAADAMTLQIKAVEEGLEKLNTDIARLEEKLADAKTRQKAIIARHQTAARRLKVRDKIHSPKIDDALVRFESFERRMEDLEGRVEAYDLGRNKDRDLHSEFVDLAAEESVERELADMKARLAGENKREAH